MNNLKRRRGTVMVHRDILYNEELDILSSFFSKFFPVHISVIFDVYAYTGMSELFDEINEGDKIPEYMAEFTQTSKGLDLKFIKQG